jgi:hypothetical protein
VVVVVLDSAYSDIHEDNIGMDVGTYTDAGIKKNDDERLKLHFKIPRWKMLPARLFSTFSNSNKYQSIQA